MSFFIAASSQEWPKWYRAKTISGKAAGLGFCCPKCHLHIRYGVPASGVFHCGKQEKPPLITALLPTRSLARDGGALPANIIPAFWNDEEEKDGKANQIFGPYVYLR